MFFPSCGAGSLDRFLILRFLVIGEPLVQNRRICVYLLYNLPLGVHLYLNTKVVCTPMVNDTQKAEVCHDLRKVCLVVPVKASYLEVKT